MQEVVCGAGGACARELQKLILALSYFQLARFDSLLHPADNRDQHASSPRRAVKRGREGWTTV